MEYLSYPISLLIHRLSSYLTVLTTYQTWPCQTPNKVSVRNWSSLLSSKHRSCSSILPIPSTDQPLGDWLTNPEKPVSCRCSCRAGGQNGKWETANGKMALAESHNYPIRMRGAEKDGAWRFNLTFYQLIGNLKIEICCRWRFGLCICFFWKSFICTLSTDTWSRIRCWEGEFRYVIGFLSRVDCLGMSDLMRRYGLWIVVARRRVRVCFVDFLYASR